MTTYSLRCRNGSCRHRRVARTHPDDYKVTPRCPVCGERKGWRIEQRAYNKRDADGAPLCTCSGPESAKGQAFPHRTTHPLCDNNPNGARNQMLTRGVKPDEMPLKFMGEVMKEDAPCPF